MMNTRAKRWIGGTIFVCIVANTAACDQAEGTRVGPRGATVSSEDGHFTLQIPAGALQDEIAVTVDEVACEAEGAVDACYAVGPVGVPLRFPARVRYEVDASMFEDFSAEALALVGENEESWAQLADRAVEPTQGSVSASAVFLSSYALVATH